MREIQIEDFKENVFKTIGTEWMLVTAGTPSHFNTMTASWGGLGVLWGKNVAFVFIRPERYTMEFIEKNEFLTLSFLGDTHRDIYKVCGSRSGRDTNKIEATGLRPITTKQGAVTFEQARLTLECRKLYANDMKPEEFIDKDCLTRWYNDKPGGSLHKTYIVEITSILKNEE